MKKSWRLLSMVGVLVVLGGVYVIASKTPTKENAGSQETKTIELLKLDQTKIKSITVKSKDSELTTEKSGDNWVVPAAQFQITQDPLKNLAQSLSAINAQKLITDNPSDLKEYGLDNPSLTVTAKLDSGEEKTLEVGNAVPTGTGTYVKLKDVNKIYTVDSSTISDLSIKLDDLRDKSIGMIATDSLNYLKVVNGGKTIELKPDDTGYTTMPGLNIIGAFGYTVSASSDKLDSVKQGLQNITAEEFVEADAKDLKKYGLDKPSGEIVAKDSSNKSIDVLIGGDKDADHYYFKLANSNTVYALSKSYLSYFFNLNVFDLYDKNLFLVYIDYVDQIDIKSPSANYTIQLSRQTKKAEKEGESDTVVRSYKVNGSDAAEEKVKPAYQKLIGLQVDAEKDKDVSGTPEVSVTYHLNQGPEKLVTINFIPYNDVFYLASINGKSEFLISKSKVSDMVAAFK